MHMELQGKEYPPYRLKPDRRLAGEMYAAMGLPAPQDVPAAYLLFLRGETRGADLFKDLDIPRLKALHGGQRYDWFAPVGWDDELEVRVRIDKLTAKESKAGPLWFADVSFEYRRMRDGVLAVREITRLVKRG